VVEVRRSRTVDVRAALLDAAAAVLERDGPAGLTVRSVAQQANVAPMGVYNHFDGMDGLQIAIIDAGFRELAEAISAVAIADPVDRLYRLGHEYRNMAKANPKRYGLMFGPEFAEKAAESKRSAFRALVEAIRYAQAAGVLRDDPAPVMARNVWAGIHGGTVLEIQYVEPNGRLAKWNQVYDQLLLMILRGLSRDPDSIPPPRPRRSR
jgi:AcrR family transcriptional regulator